MYALNISRFSSHLQATARLHGLDSFRGAVCDVDAGEGPDEVTVAVNVAEKGRHTLATTPQVPLPTSLSMQLHFSAYIVINTEMDRHKHADTDTQN